MLEAVRNAFRLPDSAPKTTDYFWYFGSLSLCCEYSTARCQPRSPGYYVSRRQPEYVVKSAEFFQRRWVSTDGRNGTWCLSLYYLLDHYATLATDYSGAGRVAERRRTRSATD